MRAQKEDKQQRGGIDISARSEREADMVKRSPYRAFALQQIFQKYLQLRKLWRERDWRYQVISR